MTFLLLGPRITWKGLGTRVKYPRGTRGIIPGKGYQVTKAKNEFEASMWQHKTETGRQTLCKTCCQQQSDSVHKCDACQALFLGTPDYL